MWLESGPIKGMRVRPSTQFASRRFPIPAVKGAHGRDKSMVVIKAAVVDAPRRRMRARLIEGFDAAPAAKQMLCSTGAEPVGGQRRQRRLQREIRMRDNEVEETRPAAHRTVAVEQFDGSVGQGETKTHRATMAPARGLDRHSAAAVGAIARFSAALGRLSARSIAQISSRALGWSLPNPGIASRSNSVSPIGKSSR